MNAYKVDSFGRDCFGNISGYVVRGPEGFRATFPLDIYREGAAVLAARNATALAAAMNAGQSVNAGRRVASHLAALRALPVRY